MVFTNRMNAGRVVAKELQAHGAWHDPLVLALPRGGVPVGYEIARALRAPLDIFLVRKLGVPGHEELALGAIATGGVRVLNEEVIAALGVSPEMIDAIAARENRELTRRESAYREGRPAPVVTGRTVLLVDDGLATGATMRAAVAALRARAPARIAVAVPVAAPESCQTIGALVDTIVCPVVPENFTSVGRWYENFDQTSDEEVRALLAARAAEIAESASD